MRRRSDRDIDARPAAGVEPPVQSGRADYGHSGQGPWWSDSSITEHCGYHRTSWPGYGV
jgi:hypothetical protein